MPPRRPWTQGGNVIQTQANQQRAQQANQGIVLYDKLSERTGPIDDILNRAAQSLAGEPNAAAQAKIKRDAHAAVRDHLAAQIFVLTGGHHRALQSIRRMMLAGHLQLARATKYAAAQRK